LSVHDRQRRAFHAAALTALAGGLGACTVSPVAVEAPTLAPPPALPAAPAEFRAAWVATVANIDWPSRPGLSAARQRGEALAMLDQAAAIGLNAIVLQVRPAADAIYPSALEPWSEYLTGAQGQPPDDGYDPLAFWIDQAHRRGLALHAWFNPYRARHPSAKGALATTHLANTQPALVKRYGDLLWMDPGEPAAAERTLAVVADVLRRYAVDGIHIDDYFYPYPISSGTGASALEQPFPDEPAWQRYLLGGGVLLRDDWRRDNVDRLVQAMHALVKRERPEVLFGISPFGLGRPERRPPGIQGFSQFHRLYANVERWCAEGWCDYLAPQLYWPIDPPAQAFGVLLDYWLAQARPGMAVWPGLFTSRIGAPQRAWGADELLRQVALLRERAARPIDGSPHPTPEPSGHIHFSMIALMQDRDGIATRLRAGPYAAAAHRPVPAARA
jgi:uncharacterized lipoprotein YddW (UPF0748 family)